MHLFCVSVQNCKYSRFVKIVTQLSCRDGLRSILREIRKFATAFFDGDTTAEKFFREVFKADPIGKRCADLLSEPFFLRFKFRPIDELALFGKNSVLCIQRTLSKSRRSGIVSGIGVACADTFMAMAALFFYSMLQTQIEQYNTLLRVIGGIFVVIVGVFIFAQNPVPQIRRNRAGKTSLWQDFASIFGLTIANFIMVIPYILAFFAVFKISGGDMADHTFGGFMRSLFVIAGFFGGAVAWWTLLAFVINLFRRRFRPRHMLTINHVAGLIIGILGIYTILSTFFDIFPNVGH